jgi:uncharacterized damage-inducible protein DinB
MAEEFPQPVKRDEVLANIRAARAELEASLAGLSEKQMTGPITEGGWSIKDHLAHIAEWQRRALAVIDGKHPSEGFGIDRETFDRLEDGHSLNEILFRRNRDRELPDVIEDFRGTHHTVEAIIEQMTDDDLQRELSGPIVQRFPRVVDLVNFNITRHDRVHIKDIRALARQPVS